MKNFTAIILLFSFALSSPAFGITEVDSLDVWNKSSPEERVSLVGSITKSFTKPGNIEPRRSDLRFLINCLNDEADTGDRKATIIDTLKVCWSFGNFDKKLTAEEIRREQADADAIRNSLKNLKRTVPETTPQRD
ncbi:hypothetical protein ACO0LM_27610 [Undibacterium sp. Di26W]|uniref:hypothetical protein n=1 Tax=Undibacterium sp. Di26W TaxID=3413035 RepID=UPI003BEFFE33